MIINIDNYKESRSNIRFIHKSVLEGNENTEQYRVILMLENKKTGIKIPHPLTEFFSSFSSLRHGSIVKKAYVVVPFLNYVIFDNRNTYGIKTLSDLTFEHGTDYLNEYAEGNIGRKAPKKKTVKGAERVLTEFYFFLAQKGLLNNIKKEQFSTSTYVDKTSKTIEYIKSPFKGVKYPNNKGNNQLKSIPYDLILPFIEMAVLETPDIALGIYFQAFGGLRVSEVINTSINAIELIGGNGQSGMIIDVKRRHFRKDISNNNGKGGVKKPRSQLIIPVIDMLPYLYKRHLAEYHKKINKKDALFVDKNNNPMTEKSYRRRFNRLKKIFIKCLENNNNPTLKTYSLYLTSKKWSTHIGRGTFSKLIADYTNNPTELAILRGDSGYESALTYIQGSFGVKEAINKIMDNLYSEIVN
ncbi:site-specific integrase [Marinisporobacter balticus]|uniref:Phage integrase family protein n=1 Tax=Marinisporobacter balticus TaxID=2018667 RepID=A0A4R2L2I5_9FIRM|nr:hypothetical protein [Marinisporobacter balticus]TCO79427.1 hypothetical protein EV214_102146 [Marinisporobacter balticus]